MPREDEKCPVPRDIYNKHIREARLTGGFQYLPNSLQETSLPHLYLFQKFQWREIRIPADVFMMYLDKTLTLTEAILLGIIDGMVSAKGLGCWASNSELAFCLRLKNRKDVQVMIRKLKRLNLVQQVGWHIHQGRKHRILETAWSRIDVTGCPPGGNKPPLQGGINPPNYILRIQNKKHKQDSRANLASAEDPKSELHEMPSNKNTFFPQMDTYKLDLQLAKQLDTALKQNQKLKQSKGVRWKKRNYSDKWPQWFRALRVQDHWAPIELQNILDWYCEEILKRDLDDKSFPQVQDAQSFRKCMNRNNWIPRLYDDHVTRNPQIEISANALQIVKQLRMLRWPKDSGKDLPVAVQLTINNYTAVKSKLRKYLELNPAEIKTKNSVRSGTPVSRMVDGLLRFLPQAELFAEQWFRSLHNRVHNWKDWHGNLLREAFSGDFKQELFHKYLASIATAYGSNPNLLSDLYKELE
jgi:hypothetical protein